MVAVAAWLLLLLLLGACAESSGFDEPGEQAAALYQAGRFAEAEPVAKQRSSKPSNGMDLTTLPWAAPSTRWQRLT
jgi:hypothetical protein